MKPLVLSAITRACHASERAFFWTGSGDNEVARTFAHSAIIQLARGLGLSERDVAAIHAIIVRHENGAVSEYDAAKRDGLVVEERVSP